MTKKNLKSGQHQGAMRNLPLRQRGVAGVVIAVALVVLVSMMALTVNVGQLYFAQRNLEKLAVISALDASRVESGCYPDGDGTPGTVTAATAAVTAAIANVSNRINGESAYPITPTVELGSFDSSSAPGKRSFTLASDPTSSAVDAVRVTLTRAMPNPLIGFPGFTPTPGGVLRASASAQHAPVASYRIGSSLANIDTSKASALNALLTALFGSKTKIALSAASFQGLANANITLGNLAAALGIANPGDLLSTQLPLGDMINGLAAAAGDNGQAAAATTLDQLAALADPSRRTTLGEALGIDERVAEGAINALPLNTLDLLTGLAKSAAQGFYPLELQLATSPNPLVSVRAFLTLGNTGTTSQGLPGQGAGRPGLNGSVRRTFADTSQLTLRLRFVVNNFALLSPLAQVKLGVDLTGAEATSNLAAIRCPALTATGANKTQPQADVRVQSTAARVALGSFAPGAAISDPVTSGSLLNAALGLITLSVTNPVSTSIPGVAAQTLTFTGPFTGSNPPAANTTETIGGPVALGTTVGELSAALAGNLSVHVLVGTVPAGTVASTLLSTIQPIITAQVDPLLNSLGIQLGGATVEMLGLDFGNNGKTPSKNSVPSLFTQDNPPVASGIR